MIRFLINAAFELQCLLEGGAYYDPNVDSVALIKGRRLFDACRFLEEMQYYKQDCRCRHRNKATYFQT